MHEPDIDTLVAGAMATVEKRKREVAAAQSYLLQAEREYKILRERQGKEKPTLADMVAANARRPVRD
jgi:hypothetical protein